MIAFKLGTQAVELDVWGPPERLSAVTLEGEPVMHGTNLYSSANGQVLSGIYEVTKGRFKVIYPFHEHATVLDGEVTLTDEAGNSVTYGPGDSWFCHQGEVVTWDVKEKLRKTFFVVNANQFVTVSSLPVEPSAFRMAG
ncbi:MAG: protein of unknown function cupin 3 [Rhizobium sp.]|nr:protein of unknown function cupin 3 [Rhizobium sp.]